MCGFITGVAIIGVAETKTYPHDVWHINRCCGSEYARVRSAQFKSRAPPPVGGVDNKEDGQVRMARVHGGG